MGHVMCPVTLPLVVAGDGGGCLKLRALAGRSLSVFLSLSIQAVAYLPVEYSSGARNGDRYGKEAENVQRTWLCELFCFPFCFSDRPPKIFLPRRFYPEGTSHLSRRSDGVKILYGASGQGCCSRSRTERDTHHAGRTPYGEPPGIETN